MHRHWFKAMIGTIGAVIIVWLIWAMLPLNHGTLALLWGQPAHAVARMQPALNRQPHDPFLRWQLGQALAVEGDLDGAIAALRPLADDPNASILALRLLIILLAEQGAADESFAVWSQQDVTRMRLPTRTAAHLLNIARNQSSAPDPSLSFALALQVLDVDATDPANQLLLEELRHPDFWDTARGQMLLSALTWLTAPIPPAAEDIPESPDLQVVADLLGVPVTQIGIGDELLLNGSFEQDDYVQLFPQHWQQWSMRFLRGGLERENTALVVGLTDDSIHGNMALRVESLWRTRQDALERVRAGALSHPVAMQSNAPYVLTFRYKSIATGRDAIQLSMPTFNLSLSEAAQWQAVTVVFRTNENTTQIAPLLRLWREGTVWLDAVSLRPLHLPAGTPRLEQHRVDQRTVE